MGFVCPLLSRFAFFIFSEVQTNQSVAPQSERVFLESACVQVAGTKGLTDCRKPGGSTQSHEAKPRLNSASVHVNAACKL